MFLYRLCCFVGCVREDVSVGHQYMELREVVCVGQVRLAHAELFMQILIRHKASGR